MECVNQIVKDLVNALHSIDNSLKYILDTLC